MSTWGTAVPPEDEARSSPAGFEFFARLALPLCGVLSPLSFVGFSFRYLDLAFDQPNPDRVVPPQRTNHHRTPLLGERVPKV